ncbi:MAG: hypothetical protein LBM98_00140 [Oscillospiraceae bacterium]|nr:hypothetical protein [Oscillospiraceae bacterium]
MLRTCNVLRITSLPVLRNDGGLDEGLRPCAGNPPRRADATHVLPSSLIFDI